MSDTKVPPIGQTTYSLQHRCTQWGVHDSARVGEAGRPYPCEGCYTLVQVNVVIPYTPHVPFTEIHSGAGDE